MFQDVVCKRFPYYFDLLEIYGDRASSKPKATSYDDLSEDSDEEDYDDDGECKEVEAKEALKRKLTGTAFIQKKKKSSQMLQIFSPKVKELEKMSKKRNELLKEKIKLVKKGMKALQKVVGLAFRSVKVWRYSARFESSVKIIRTCQRNRQLKCFLNSRIALNYDRCLLLLTLTISSQQFIVHTCWNNGIRSL